MKSGSIVFFKVFGKFVEGTIVEFGSKNSKVDYDNKIFQVKTVNLKLKVKTVDLKLSNESNKN
jgi:hypothetical protein